MDLAEKALILRKKANREGRHYDEVLAEYSALDEEGKDNYIIAAEDEEIVAETEAELESAEVNDDDILTDDDDDDDEVVDPAAQAEAERAAQEKERTARIQEDERKAVVNDPELGAAFTSEQNLEAEFLEAGPGGDGVDAAVAALSAIEQEVNPSAASQAASPFPQQFRNLVQTATQREVQGATTSSLSDDQNDIIERLNNGEVSKAEATTLLYDTGATEERVEQILAQQNTLETFDFAGTETTIKNTYQDVAYVDKLSSGSPPEDPETIVELPESRLVRYAEGEEAENEGPVFLIDALVWIQGVEVSQFVKGEIQVNLSGTDGHNTASFTIDNSDDRFVWTERNLVSIYGESAILADAPFVKEFAKAYEAEISREVEERVRENPLAQPFRTSAQSPTGSSIGTIRPGTQIDEELRRSTAESTILLRKMRDRAFNQQEQAKEEIFNYKADPTRNPPIRNPKNAICFARYDLAPGRCCFNRMDAIRIFSLYPFRVPGKEYEDGNRQELWMPEFTGYIETVSIDEDEIRGVSSITIEAVDIRQAVLRRMRTRYSGITTGLVNPLEQLGFAVGAQNTITAGQGQAALNQARSSTDGFYDIDNTLFYDDIVVTPFGQASPNKPLEGALREVLVENAPITLESNNRGVRGVSFGGNFYYDAANWSQTQSRTFLEQWHKFTLFGPKRRPWTRTEVDEVGRGTTTDGAYAPNKVRLWQLLPRSGSGAKNLADLSVISYPVSNDSNWTNRMETITNFVQSADYNFMVTACGDLVTEFNMGDFRPEDFGEFRHTFRLDKGLISSQFGDEQEVPPAGLVVTRGMAAGVGIPDDVAADFFVRTFVYSPYIAARYGIEIDQESLPFLQQNQETLAQQRSVLMYQRRLAQAHALNATFAYRPFILPNRPVHHLRRNRIGRVVSTDKTISLSQQPQGQVSVGLDCVRIFTGYYRSNEDFSSINEKQREDNATKGQAYSESVFHKPDSPTADYLERQVFNTIASGEAQATSARVPWGAIPDGEEGEIAVLAPNSGIYVLGLTSDKPKPEVTAPPAHDNAGEAAPAEGGEEGDPPLFKFAADPLDNVRVTSGFGVNRNVGSDPHNGTDFEAATGTPVYAVGKGTIIRASSSTKGGEVVLLETDSGFWVQYIHLDPRSYASQFDPNDVEPSWQPNFRGVTVGQRVEAGEQIAVSDNTGSSTAPHLHIDLIIRQQAIDNGFVDERGKRRLRGSGGERIGIFPYLPSGNYSRPSGGSSGSNS